jgi:hypothetical protein
MIAAVQRKVQAFVKNSPQFKEVCEHTFAAIDHRKTARVTFTDAASCVDALFRELQTACSDFGETTLGQPLPALSTSRTSCHSQGHSIILCPLAAQASRLTL